jgi:hypothetical protein
MHAYHVGDKGMVLRQVAVDPGGTWYYLVKMDKDDPAKTGVIFTAGEIEPDV